MSDFKDVCPTMDLRLSNTPIFFSELRVIDFCFFFSIAQVLGILAQVAEIHIGPKNVNNLFFLKDENIFCSEFLSENFWIL